MRGSSLKYRLTLVALIFINLVLLGMASSQSLLPDETVINGGTGLYEVQQNTTSKLVSRRWLAHSINLAKKDDLSPPSAARIYAYISSAFADTLENTSSTGQASLVTKEITEALFPKYRVDTALFVQSLAISEISLSSESQEILSKYKNRISKDNFELVWDQKIPSGPNRWYNRDRRVDLGARAGEWLPWIIESNYDFSLPSPPKPGSLDDLLELEKVSYANKKLSNQDFETIVYWYGSTGFKIGNSGENLTPAGIWQNILYVEMGEVLDELKYAQAQRLLAQALADTSIFTWKTKYDYWTQPPSMRMANLNFVLSDAPYPSFVSEHSALSKTASVTLEALFPDKRELWERVRIDSENTRLVSGLNFSSDIKAGAYLGEQVGHAALKKYYPEKTSTNSASFVKPNLAERIFQFTLLKVSNTFRLMIDYLSRALKDAALILSPPPKSGFTDIRNNGLGFHHSPGASWVDYNGDGYLDLFTSGNLYKNNKDGTFTNVTSEAKLPQLQYFSAGVFGDYNNDGCPDLYVSMTSTTDTVDFVGIPDLLFRNNCDGTFSDVSKDAHINDNGSGRGAAWVDYNNDGLLDLYVVNITYHEATEKINLSPAELKKYSTFRDRSFRPQPNILYRNNGDGTFTNVTSEAKVLGVAKCNGVTMNLGTGLDGEELGQKVSYQPIWFDYNNDGWQDLYVATDSGVSPLYKNNKDGTFTDVTQSAGLCRGGSGMGVTTGDYNNDGWLDIYHTNTGKNYLWKNNGNGTFTEVAQLANATDMRQGWGAQFVDYDNDGNLDLYLVNGTDNTEYSHDPSVDNTSLDEFFENQGNGSFRPLGRKLGFNSDLYKRGVAVGDYNNDGFPDLYIPALKDNRSNSHLYLNKGNSNHWVTIQLVGTKSNRDAIGSRLTASIGQRKLVREVQAGAAYSSQSSLWQTFGLGKAKKIDSLEIIWPSGIKQTLTNIRPDHKMIVTESK